MELTAQKRSVFGKAVRTLRRKGLIPAELYGHGVENIHLAVEAREFGKIFREAGVNTIVNLRLEDALKPVIIYAVDRDYITGEVIHIDFYLVRMDEKVTVRIPLEFRGEAPAVKEKNGVLSKAMNEIEVEVLPGRIPHNFIVNLETLDEIGKSICVKDLLVAEDVKFKVDPETVIVTVQAEEEEKTEEPISVEDVKVEGEEKKLERLRAAEEIGDEK